MSRRNNVTPDHYKVAERERTGNTGNAAAEDSKAAAGGEQEHRAGGEEEKERQKLAAEVKR